MSTTNIGIGKYNYLMISKGFLFKILTLKESIRQEQKYKSIEKKTICKPSLLIQEQG
jgi:hypothetical protein